MSRLFPHPPYAEDQTLSKTILTTHVLTRGFQTGSIIGAALGPPIYLVRRSNLVSQKYPKLSIPQKPFTSLAPKSLAMVTIRSAGIGSVVGTVLLSVGLISLMRGKKEIEWKDRSWRLLENKFQVEVDDFTYFGAAVGAISAVPYRSVLGWKGSLGVVALGSVGGLFGYGGWRYGVKGGSFEEVREEVKPLL